MLNKPKIMSTETFLIMGRYHQAYGIYKNNNLQLIIWIKATL